MTDRRRNALVLLLVAGLIAASLVVIATKKTRLGLDLKGGVELVYQAKPTAQSKVDSESLNRAIDIMRKRVDQLGVAQPEIQRSGADEIDVALPERRATPSAPNSEVGKTAQLYFYDWEPNVIGARRPAGPDRSDRHGRAATPATRSSGCPSTRPCCAPRNAPPILRKTRHDAGRRAARPQQVGGCIYGTWYLLDTKHEKVLRGPEETEKNLYADNYKTAGRRQGRRRCASTPARCSCRRARSKAAGGKVTQQAARTAGTCSTTTRC